jgi:hypothetical protein
MLVCVICCAAAFIILTFAYFFRARTKAITRNMEFGLNKPVENNTTNKYNDDTSTNTCSEAEFRSNTSIKKLIPATRKRSLLTKAKRLEWRKGDLLGVGAYGKVYAGLNLNDGMNLATCYTHI